LVTDREEHKHMASRISANVTLLAALLFAGTAAAQIPTAYKHAVASNAGEMYLESMYLPSVTRGPWSPTWSPDGREIVFAMHGSLWKVPAEGGQAEQITSSSEYDSEPQWSPDGRQIAFTRDSGKAMEIWVVNSDGSGAKQVTNSGAISVDPEWNSASQILYSSNAGGNVMGLWQVGADGSAAQPFLADASQSIEPTSSPDGKFVVFLSSREIAPGRRASYGSGDFWKINVADKSLHLLSRQETLWHTHPRWSPDGHRIAYVSLQTGRNQLFVMDAETGLPAQLTYMQAEPFTPCWSPDGQKIALISNADHHFALWIMPAAGGAASAVKITSLKWRQPMARLQVSVHDETGKPTLARFYIHDHDGKSWAPEGAFERVSIVTGDHYFYAPSSGSFAVPVPAGALTVEVMKGFEYRPQKKAIEVREGQTQTISLSLERTANLEGQGWYSGDNHMHMNYGGVLGEAPQYLLQEAEAEDLDVVNDFPTNHNTHLIDYQYFTGKADPHSTAGRVLYFNEEYRPNFGGHMGLLNMKQFFFPVYDGYTGTPYAADYPSNAQVLDVMHAQGAIGGYVHPYLLDRGQDPLAGNIDGAREFPADVALGKVDFYDLMCIWTDKYVAGDVLYRIWNLGFRIPISAGTDAMPDYWRAPTIGGERVYVHSGSPLNYEDWIRALTKGHVFVTNGPLVTLDVDGHGPGDELQLTAASASSVHVKADAASVLPMDQLEILQDGKVVKTEKATDPHHIALSASLPVSQSGWIAVRVSGPEKVHLLTDSYVYAHTNPVWVIAGGQKPSSPQDAEYFVRWMEKALQQIPGRTFDTDQEKKAVEAVYTQAREEFRRLAGNGTGRASTK
jgi:TolB protein